MKSLRVLIALALLITSCRKHSDLPKLFPVPDVTLVNEAGKSVSLASNKGYVTVYDFVFTSCTGTCPMMTSNMRALTKQIAKDAPVRFVSISVDPTRDTPAVLNEYAKRVRNDDRWMFLTGDRATIVRLSVEGFKLAAGDPAPGGEALLHSSKFAVADKNGMIREYYGGTDGDLAQHVAKTINELVGEE
ncbi:MAG TPA: SCO family protein [Thermoanaerobaculia bacterium]|nr:SCO family protein [Thermoanaerobaculia bacterium]